MQIGNIGGDRRGFCFECDWQAAERAVDIVGGEGLAARMARCDAVGARKQRLQFGLHFEDHCCARARQQRGIADELYAVAEPLFGGEQYRALTKGKFTEPGSAAVPAAHVSHAAAFPSPFVFGKPTWQLPEREKRERHVGMCIGEILVDGDRFFETCNRVGVAVECL